MMSPGCPVYHDGQNIAQWSHSLYYSSSQFLQMHELLLVTSSVIMIDSDNIADTGILGVFCLSGVSETKECSYPQKHELLLL